MMDEEALEVAQSLPPPSEVFTCGASGQFSKAAPNAVVSYDPVSGRVEIMPVGGGWLGCPIVAFIGDIAPGHG